MATSVLSKLTPVERAVARSSLGRVVKDLTHLLKGKNHVFFDNFFTSEKLLEDLLEDDIMTCGTARKDHKVFPMALKNANLKNRYIMQL